MEYQRNFMDALQGGYQFGQQIKQQQDNSALNKFAGKAMTETNPLMRQNQVAEMAGIDRNAGFATERNLQASDEQRNATMVNMARLFTNVPEDQRAALWRSRMYPELTRLGLQVPNEYDESTKSVIIPAAESILKAAAGPAEQYTLTAGSKRFDSSGRVIAEVPFAPNEEDWALYDSADGPQWIRKPSAAMFGPGAPQPSPQQPPAGNGTAAAPSGGFGIAETDNYVRTIMGNAGQIDPNAPPAVIVEQLLPHVIKQESNGNPNAVSPKGAQGLMQVMPTTGKDPGFGVSPLQNNSPEENVRFGRDYLTAMVKRYPGRPDLALAAYNAGPGVADRFKGSTAQNGGGPGIAPVNNRPMSIPIPGVRPKPKESDQVRTLTAAEVAQFGLAPGTVAQIDRNNKLDIVYKPEKADGAAGGADGLNDRQRVGMKGVQRNLISYAAALTGIKQDELKEYTAEEIAEAIKKKGGRFMQGGVARTLSTLPLGKTGVEAANADIVSYSQGAGSAWATYENPTGMITNTDRESATAQMPNPNDPLEVQADKIKNFLDLTGWGGAGATQGAKPNTGGQRGGGVQDLSDDDLLRQLNGGG